MARDRFESATELQLDSLYAPLVYLMHEDEQGTYASLSVDDKRVFLRRFWARRTPKAAKEFNARIGTVNRKFSEYGPTAHGTAPVPGWRTDRGRIYLEVRPARHHPEPPRPGAHAPLLRVEVHAGNQRPRKYCFVDITGFGNYVLVYSNDSREPSRSNWRQLLGDDGYADALDF